MAERNYLPNDLKYIVDIKAAGFDMDINEWSVGVKCGSKIVHIYTKDECIRDDNGKWFVCIEKEVLKKGDLYLIGYAEVPDSDFPDGYRSECDRSPKLGTLEAL